MSTLMRVGAVALGLSLPTLAQEKSAPIADATAKGQAATVQVDAKIPAYVPTSGVSGSLKSIGSDTMGKEMQYWAEGFRKLYPNVQIEVENKGSGYAPAALIEGTAQFGPMSRPMKKAEIDSFEKAFGYKPTEIVTSIDMLAVYVHKDNPIKSLTLQQVDAIFSKARKGGYEKDIRTWGDLGLTGDWADKPLSLYGRNSASGTYGYFKEHALSNGDYKDTVKEQSGSSAVVQAVANDKFAIGYSGIGYKTADVRAVPLAVDAKAKVIEATPENAYTGQYALSRFLFLYVNAKPNTPLDPLRQEFLRYVLSREGQTDVVREGYYPLTMPLVQAQLAKIGAARQ